MITKLSAFSPIVFVSKQNNEQAQSNQLKPELSNNHEKIQLSSFKQCSAAIVSFGYDFRLKSEEGLPCPCCGNIMSTNKEINRFTNQMSKATGDKIIEGIEKYEDRLPDVERNVTNRLKIAAAKYDNLNLNGLMRKIQNEPKKELERTQKIILNEIKNLSEGLTGNTNKVIQKDINAIDKIIIEGRNGNPFKRKTLIQGMEKVRDNESDPTNKIILEQIVEKAMDLPTSSNDANAFIVKYSRRSSSEIAHRLIEPTQATAEHIHPHSKNGHDGADNYLSECKKCNNDRGNMTYVEWLDIHPEMKENTQIYMNEVIKRMKNGSIKDFDFYPQSVKNAVYSESGGKIDIDISDFIDYRKQKLHERTQGHNETKSKAGV